MAISPNYSWPLPDDTDLVKNGAEAIRDLGNAIDTTVDGLGSGGLVHINSTSFSAVSSISVDDVFSTTHKNYLIKINVIASTTLALSFRFRTGGTPNSNSNYQRMFFEFFSSTFGSNESSTASNQTSHVFGNIRDIGKIGIDLIMFNPFQTEITNFQSSYSGYRANSLTSPSITTAYGNFNQTTSFDGIEFTAPSGNITGTLAIFGYKD